METDAILENLSMFLDLKKAFDLVNHEILCRKLACYIGDLQQVSFFKSYLEERKQKVLLNGKYSSTGQVRHGVPQGSVLGPLLFCIFITISSRNLVFIFQILDLILRVD